MRRETHRQRQAQATRDAVTAAARALFAERGYVATAMEAIAAAAEIPVQTIYSAFGAKPAVLEEIRRNWVLESGVADHYARAMEVSDPRRRLARAAHWTRRQFELGHDVVTVYQEAARADPRVATAWRQALEGREAAVRQLLASLKPALRPGLSVRAAVDLYVALTVPEIYGHLVLARGWSAARYEAWLAEALQDTLLGRPARLTG